MEYNSLKHTTWHCKYHAVFIPKYRKKATYGQIRKDLGSIFKNLANQKEVVIEEGHLMIDHVHMLVSVPPSIAISKLVQYMKGKSSSKVMMEFAHLKKRYWGQHIISAN